VQSGFQGISGSDKTGTENHNSRSSDDPPQVHSSAEIRLHHPSDYVDSHTVWEYGFCPGHLGSPRLVGGASTCLPGNYVLTAQSTWAGPPGSFATRRAKPLASTHPNSSPWTSSRCNARIERTMVATGSYGSRMAAHRGGRTLRDAGLLPGNYLIFAVPDDLQESHSADFADRNFASAQRLTVRPRETATLILMLEPTLTK